MPEQAAEKTEQPTTRRLSKARGKGQVPQSQELTSIVTLLVLVAMLALLAPNLLQMAFLLTAVDFWISSVEKLSI
jgi:flagellar biosynthesis protein FlhB